MKRREFITSGVAGSLAVGAGSDAQAARETGRLPGESGENIRRLMDGLYWIRDTCNAYLLVRGARALMIDCGTDTPEIDLKRLGVARVERILLTHFHRDQSAAAGDWQRRGAGIVVPYYERRYLEEPNLLRAAYDVYDSYVSYYPYFGPVHDLKPDGYAYDYQSLEWQGIRFSVIPLPGHTYGSAGYLFELDGRKILACGDLMSRPGKLTAYHPSQWSYMVFQGHINHLESLETVAGLKPDLMLTGHGEPFPCDAAAIDGLRKPLERIYELFHAKPHIYYRPSFRQVTKHVFQVTNSGSHTYIVKDDEGHALFIDCGYTSAAPINANPHRFIDHLTPYLEREVGVKEVEWYVPSHYHDDHLAGYPALRSRYGTKLFCAPELKDILEHPERYNMPCLLPQGLEVHRTVERGQAFPWRGIDFFVEQHPGQTIYHHLIWFRADGKKFLAIGDNISGLSFLEARDHIYSFIPKNRTPVSSYGTMPRQILDHAPDVLLTGHGGAVDYDRQKMERWRTWMDEWQGIWTRMLDQEAPDEGMDPQWVEFYPYKVRIRPGESVRFEVRVTNHHRESRTCRIRFRSAQGVKLDPAAGTLEVPAGALGRINVTASFPSRLDGHSIPVVADVTWGGRRLGEIAEAIAYW